jgi:hypothetical protein
VTTVRIAHAVPRPGARPDGGFLVSEYLVMLTEAASEDAARRALPLWLQVPGGDALWQLLNRPAKDPVMAGVLEETAARLLDAAGVAVTAVDLLVTSHDAVQLRSADVAARVELGTADGTRYVTVSAGYGLALAAASGAPVRVADVVLDRLAVPVMGDDLVTQFLPAVAARAPGRLPQRWRFEPRNLTFADGLDRWELIGDAEEPHRQDYSCAAGSRSVTLASAVQEPQGSAVLVQTIFADDYRDTTLALTADVRADLVSGRAGLLLEILRDGWIRAPDARQTHDVGVPAGRDWARNQITAPIPDDADLIRFGVTLTGPGLIELRNPALGARQTPAIRQP